MRDVRLQRFRFGMKAEFYYKVSSHRGRNRIINECVSNPIEIVLIKTEQLNVSNANIVKSHFLPRKMRRGLIFS